MNFSLLKLHPRMLLLNISIVIFAIALSLNVGQSKPWLEVDRLDLIGEGGIVLLTMTWQLFLFISRPPGRVTTLLTFGLSCFMFSALLDWLDEFFQYPESALLPMIENIPAPIGMILITIGLYQWHQELLALNTQLRRREANVREHADIDQITQLYRAEYMREYITQHLHGKNASCCVAFVDIDQFDNFNRCYGHTEGDRLLREVAELILMNVRQADLVCRYAGDRFILLMPDLPIEQARIQVQQISDAVKHLAFKTGNNAVFHTLTTAVVLSEQGEPCEALLRRLSEQLEAQKFSTQVFLDEAFCYAER
jgi:diguanylate cyclase (GGDEF)-like protein